MKYLLPITHQGAVESPPITHCTDGSQNTIHIQEITKIKIFRVVKLIG